MSQPNHNYILVYFAEPVEVGCSFERTRSGWPLHVTIVPWFSITGSVGDFINEVENQLCQQKKPFEATIGNDEHLGANRDIPVSLVVDQKPFRNLQGMLLRIVEAFGQLTAAKTWLGDNYRPHVTHHDDKRLHPSDILVVDKISLVLVDDQNVCEVVQHFALGNRRTGITT